MLYAQVARKGGAILKWPIRPNEVAETINVSLPADEKALEQMDLSVYGIYPVPESPVPAPSSPTAQVVLAEPIWEDGGLVRQYTERQLTEEQVNAAWNNIRKERNARLRATDWSQSVADIDPETKEKFAAYRQKLRDLTETNQSPFAVEWPVHPDDQP